MHVAGSYFVAIPLHELSDFELHGKVLPLLYHNVLIAQDKAWYVSA